MRRSFTLFISFVAICLVACGKTESPTTTAPIERVTIAQYGHVFLYLPLYVAQAKGYFREQGLDVSLVSTGGDDKTFSAVASGSAQYGVADPVFTAIAREQGNGGKVVALLVNGIPFWGVTFRDDINEIIEPSAFQHLRIATYPSPSTNFAVMEETLQNAGHPVAATIVQGAFGTLLALLKTGKADIAMELEPVTSIAVSEGAKVVYSAARKYGDFAFTGITVTDKYLETHPEQIQLVVNALSKAITYIRSDFDGALSLASEEFPDVAETVLRTSLKRILNDNVIPSSLVLNEVTWNRSVQLRRNLGEIKGPALYSDNVVTRFAEHAR